MNKNIIRESGPPVPVPGGTIPRPVFVDYARRLGWGTDLIAVTLRTGNRTNQPTKKGNPMSRSDVLAVAKATRKTNAQSKPVYEGHQIKGAKPDMTNEEAEQLERIREGNTFPLEFETSTPADPKTIQKFIGHNQRRTEPVQKMYKFDADADADEPRLWPEIRTIIETHIRNQPRSQQVELGPSELGTTCLHCLAAKLAGWPKQNQQAGWLPFIGTSVHAQFEQLFPKLNHTGFDEDHKGQRFETEKKVTVGHLSGLYGGYDISGHIDLFDRWNKATADWKVVGNTSLRLVKARGPSQQYLVQASLYGIGLDNENEPIERSAIYFLPRNGISLNDAIAWEADWTPQPGRWALSRAQLLVNFMDVIEQADGPAMKDAWISLLPKATDHCFDCGSWPDDGPLSDLTNQDQPTVPDKWQALIPLLEPTFNPTK